MLMFVLGIMAVAVMVVPVANAQPGFAIDKGSMAIGGTASFSMSGGDLYKDADDNSETSFSLAPMALYFVIPNLAVGGEVSFGRDSQGDYSNTSYGIGPKVLYAFGKQESMTYPYLSAGFGYLSHTTNNTYNDVEYESKTTGTSIKVAGGVFLMPGQQHLGINIEAGYVMDSLKGDEDNAESVSGNQIVVNVGLIGFLN